MRTGLDAEQVELGSSAKFWELITLRRQQETMTRDQLEQKVRRRAKRQPASRRKPPADH